MTARPFIAGNWKMFGRRADLEEISAVEAFVAAAGPGRPAVALCPPFTLLDAAVAATRTLAIGAQDCHAGADGAHTGDVNAAMLADLGVRHVIVGHSERRQGYGETDAMVRAKAEAALTAGLGVIICVGETLAERRAGQAGAVVAGQIAGSVPPHAAAPALALAYEPVWAIGTGLTPTAAEIEAVHAQAKQVLPPGTPVLYGGSVKPANAADIFSVPGVDGALVGGASLKASDFLAILRAHPGFAGS